MTAAPGVGPTISRLRRGRGEEGSSLTIALAFVSFLGVLVVSILTVSFAGFKTTQVVRTANTKLYAADGGADVGLQLLRTNSSYCPSTSSNVQNLPSQTINGRAVSVTCQVVGSGSGGGGGSAGFTYSVITTGYPGPTGATPNLSKAFDTSNSSQKGDLRFGGPAFNAGGFTFSGNGPRLVFESTLDEYDAPSTYCTSAKSAAAGSGNPQVNGAWTCRQPSSFAVPDPVPTLKVPSAAAPASRVVSGCTILFPGKYTTKPTFSSSGKYYLASGVYYFENTGTITLNGTVFGGAPGSSETKQFTGSTPCSTDAAANALVPGAASGTGVELVLGGASSITVANSTSAKVELYSRTPGNASIEGTPGVSIYAPGTAGTGYLAWNSAAAVDLPNSKPQIVIHGVVYTPNSPLSALIVKNASAGNAALFGGGVVVQTLTIKTTGSQPFSSLYLAGPVATPVVTSRSVLVTATASDPAGGAAVTVRAVAEFVIGSSGPPTVLSWRKV